MSIPTYTCLCGAVDIGVLLGGTIKDDLNDAADVDGAFDDLLALDPCEYKA